MIAKKALTGLWATCVFSLLHATPVLAAAEPDVVLYAADAVNLKGNWARVAEPSAAGGKMLSSANIGWSATNAPLAEPFHSFEFTFNAAANTPYHIWMRVRALDNSKYNDSLYAQFSDALSTNGASRYRIGTTDALLVNLATDANATSLLGWGWQDGAYWFAQSTTLKFASSGSHTLRVQTREDGVQLDQVVLSASTYLSNSPGVITNDLKIVAKPPAFPTSFGAAAVALPGIVEAEHFDNGGPGVGYYDVSAGNEGGAFRQTDVDIESSTEHDYDIGWISAGEWLSYATNVQAAGTYTLEARVASLGDGGTFHIEFGGTNVTGPMTIPNTGGWQGWTTLSKTVSLASAGAQQMRVVFDSTGPVAVGNLNWVRLSIPAAPPAPTPPSSSAANIVIYASDIPATALHGTWSRASDSTSPAGVKLTTPNRGLQSLNAPLASPIDYVDVSFAPLSGTPYRIWLRLKAQNNDKYNDAVWVQFSNARANGSTVYATNSTNGLLVNLATNAGASTLRGWGWQNGAYWLPQATTVTFPSSGTQTMRIQIREDGVELDQIVLSPMTYASTAPGPVTGDTTIVAKTSTEPTPVVPLVTPVVTPPPPTTPATATGGRTVTVSAGDDLQVALDSAMPGDTLLLQAGATFTGNFILPAKTGTSYITIRSSAADSALPGPTGRMNPSYQALLPKIRSGNTGPALATAPGAHHYRLLFLEFPATYQGYYDIIRLGDGSSAQNSLAMVPYELVVDRVYIHGDPVYGQKRGICLNSASTTIVNSYISEIKTEGQDTQAVGGWNGPGPYTITNNYLEAAGENVMFGGADPAIPNLIPSDIVITRNVLSKPAAWRNERWTIKNLLELKSARRVVISGNILEYNWLAAQTGYAVQFTPRNQDGGAPWTVVENVEFTNNVVRHVAAGINILGVDNNHPSLETNNIVIRNNLFENVNSAIYGGQGRFMQITGGGRNITVDHNTVLQDGWTVVAVSAIVQNFVFTNNIVPDYSWAIFGDSTSPGNDAIATYFPYSTFLGNIFAGSSPARYPGGNHFPATLANIGFVNYIPMLGGNYRLSFTSLYRNAGNDGKDVGADIDAINAAAGTAY